MAVDEPQGDAFCPMPPTAPKPLPDGPIGVEDPKAGAAGLPNADAPNAGAPNVEPPVGAVLVVAP